MNCCALLQGIYPTQGSNLVSGNQPGLREAYHSQPQNWHCIFRETVTELTQNSRSERIKKLESHTYLVKNNIAPSEYSALFEINIFNE